MKSLFSSQGQWFKGMLHSHTTESDGWLSPERVLKAYKSMGYDFVCLTDHWKVTPKPEKAPEDLLYIPGVELDGGDTGVGNFHLVGIDVRDGAAFKPVKPNKDYSARELFELLRAEGGLIELAHPSWNGVTCADAADIADDLFAMEVWNSGCDVEIGRGLADVQWDDLLSRNHKIKGIAVDDAHRYYIDSGKGWVMVRAEALTRKAVRAALEKGDFYSSTGPIIHDVLMDDASMTIKCSPVRKIDLVSSPTKGQSTLAPQGSCLTEHTFQLPKEKGRYARFRITDFSGCHAWTNAVFF